ncbi:Arylsulfatase A [Pseudarcicella hirudinis]|uniref:Arylsulfatase A n=1 Tax=Pseudarcicella hirudinis TaxID=1079859 RepID=A0A1I5TVQ3_9BACT|nr:sulfatase [Pseudarcicella hirudinis]SFP87160.1 Arylsulfatase A [Pseudarcicella hirudinis]
MKLYTNVKLICLCMICLTLNCFTISAQVKTKRKPNILVIITDQWRGQALGFIGKEKVKTPNLDALASKGLAVTQMVTNYPVCSPARAMLLTGTYPAKNKVHGNANSNTAPYGVELPSDIVCWSDILKQQGYSNGYIGKWHLDSPHQPYIQTKNNEGGTAWNEWTPFDRRHGFDYWYAYNTYDYHSRPMYWDTKALRDEFHFVDQWGPVHEADKAIDFFDNKGNVRNPNAPFSLVVSINPPHSPYNTAPEKYQKAYENMPLDSLLSDADIPPAGTPMGEEYRKNIKDYYANITGVDEQIGRIIDALKEKKMLDNTIVLITADHGNCLGKHDEVSKNNIYEASLSIPLIVYWKGHISPDIDKKFLGSLVDVCPTLLDLAGLKKEIPATVDGKSYADYFLNRKGAMPTEQFFMGALNNNDTKLSSGFRGIRTDNYKLAYQRKGKQLNAFLYDIKADPFEQNNLYNKDNPQVKILKTRLISLLKKYNDSFTIE